MKRIVLIAAALLTAAPAFAQSVGEKTGVNSTLGISPATADFVKEVAISDMFELQSNKLAEERGNAAEKSFAATMIKDHTKTSDELKSLIKSGDVKADLPSALDSSHQSKLDKLNGYKGADFSSEFNSQQVSAHKDAVSPQRRRQSEAEGLGWEKPPCAAASSGHGAGPQEVRWRSHRTFASRQPGECRPNASAGE